MKFLYTNQSEKCTQSKKNEKGFVMITIITFIPIVFMFSALTIVAATQAYRTTLNQELIREAQLASVSAMDFAKEQYEIDLNYLGTAETTLYTTDLHEITYEVIHKGFSNTANTQQDIAGVGRVYTKNKAKLLYSREIQGKITYTSGSNTSVRFIFIVDNSGSMSESEWLQSKSTVDASINYIIDNAPTAEVAVLQYGTNNFNQEHKYDVTVSFTRDKTTATNWDRRYGPGSSSTSDFQDHLPGSLARMRLGSVYGPGDALDLSGATDIQFVLFTDARGSASSGGCCSSLKKLSGEPTSWNTGAGATYPVLDNYGEYNQLKDGTVFAGDGYPGLTAQWTVLSVYDDDNNINTTSSAVSATRAISAAIASVGGNWNSSVDANTDDPEGNNILPRKLIATTLAAGPNEIISLLQEILDAEINI